MIVFDLNYHLHKTLSISDKITGRKLFSGTTNKDNEKDAGFFVWKFLLDMFYDLKKVNVKNIVLCQDSSSWRKSISTEYKASRVGTRDFEYIYHLIREIEKVMSSEFNITFLRSSGLEADDLIMLTKEVSEKQIVIISGDKDILQLATPNSLVYYKPTKTTHSNHGIIPFEKVLFGDKSDEISPSMEGITKYRKKICDNSSFVNYTSKQMYDLIKNDIDSLISQIIKYFKVTDIEILKKGLIHNAKMVLLVPENIPTEIMIDVKPLILEVSNFEPNKETISYICGKIDLEKDTKNEKFIKYLELIRKHENF